MSAPTRALPSLVLLLGVGLASSIAATACGRLPVIAVRYRYALAQHERGGARSMAIWLGCGLKLERGRTERAYPAEREARVTEPPPSVAAPRCADASLCAWQHAAELRAERALLPLIEEELP